MRRLLSGAVALVVAAAVCSVVSAVTSAPPAAAATSATGALSTGGYWTFGANARTNAYGGTGVAGNDGLRLNSSVVGGAATSSGKGYWMVGGDGGVFSYGDAKFFGSTGSIHLNQPVVGMTANPIDSGGYWFVASDGGVFAYGNAGFFGSMGGKPLNKPIVGMAATPSGGGYWLVASDGGIFAFGDAKFYGSSGAIKLNQPIVGMAATPSGGGYWLVASDGGIFTYGAASFSGSAGAIKLAKPVVGMATTQSGAGYWLIANDGGVFTYGDAKFAGAPTGQGAVTGIASAPRQRTSETSIFYYPWYGSVAHDGAWKHWDEGQTPPDYLGTDYWPTRGPYSSSDSAVTTAQMNEIKAAGIDTIVISWWGQGSYEDTTLATIVPEAQAAGLRVAIHEENWAGRSAVGVASDIAYLQAKGITEFYIYQADALDQNGLAAAVAAAGPNSRVFGEAASAANMKNGSFEVAASKAGFTGVYTYAAFGYSAADFNAVCDYAHALHMLCSPSPAPGFTEVRAVHRTSPSQARNAGATYDNTWRNAINAGADVVSITSYNEWHEGSQIESAIPHAYPDATLSLDYTGAYGDPSDARNSYMDRTKMWTGIYKARFPAAF